MLEWLLYPIAFVGAGVAAVCLFLLVTGLCATVDFARRRSSRRTARDGAAG